MTALRIRIVTGSGSSAMPPFVFYSLAGHVLFVGALLLIPSLRGAKPFPNDAVVVSLVAAPRPAAQVQAPPAPRPEPVRPEPPQGTRVTPVEPVRKPMPDEAPPPPKPAARKTAPAPPSTETSAPTVEEAGSSITVVESGDVEFAWYRASVTAALFGQWRRPILDGVAETYEVGVYFEILRDGAVRGVRIESSSGIPSLDRSALRAVSDAVPLPPLPSTWRATVLPARYVFRLLPE